MTTRADDEKEKLNGRTDKTTAAKAKAVKEFEGVERAMMLFRLACNKLGNLGWEVLE